LFFFVFFEKSHSNSANFSSKANTYQKTLTAIQPIEKNSFF
jgi:hypothetical protein